MTSTRGGWLASPSGPLAGWLTSPERPGDLGVVVLPPLAYEASTAYRTVRAVAEQIAARGARALRVEYAGTGNSAGASASLSLRRLREALPAAATTLREQGASRIAVVGLRLGGLLAILDAAAVGATDVVAWAPVLPGRRYPRELRLLGDPAVPEAGLGATGVVVAGHALPGPMLEELTSLEMSDVTLDGLHRMVVLDRDDRHASDALLAAAHASSVVTEHVLAGGHAEFLDCPTEDAVIPRELVATVAELAVAGDTTTGPVLDLRDPAAPLPVLATVATYPNLVDGRVTDVVKEQIVEEHIVEEHVVLGPRQLTGVRTFVRGTSSSTTLLMTNVASDPHQGSARTWVDLARALAPMGMDVIRLDFTGWGESPNDPRVTGRPYDLHAVDDIDSVAVALHEQGVGRCVLVGMCSGAWIGLHAARTLASIDGVIAINPQLYWHVGDPIEALMADTNERRVTEVASIKAAGLAGIWDAEDAAGVWPEESSWLQELSDAGLPVDLLFTRDDEGLEHLRDRINRRVTLLERDGRLHVTELAGGDHGLTEFWFRPTVATAIKAAVDRQETLTVLPR